MGQINGSVSTWAVRPSKKQGEAKSVGRYARVKSFPDVKRLRVKSVGLHCDELFLVALMTKTSYSYMIKVSKTQHVW